MQAEGSGSCQIYRCEKAAAHWTKKYACEDETARHEKRGKVSHVRETKRTGLIFQVNKKEMAFWLNKNG